MNKRNPNLKQYLLTATVSTGRASTLMYCFDKGDALFECRKTYNTSKFTKHTATELPK